MTVKPTHQIASQNLTVAVWFRLLSLRLSGLLESTKRISRNLENSGLGPQAVQDISFHLAKRFVAKVPEYGVSKNVETFSSE